MNSLVGALYSNISRKNSTFFCGTIISHVRLFKALVGEGKEPLQLYHCGFIAVLVLLVKSSTQPCLLLVLSTLKYLLQ